MTIKNLTLFIITILIFIECKPNVQKDKKGTSKTTIKVDDRIQLFRLAYNLAIMDSIAEKYQPCKNQFYYEHYLSYKKYSNHPFVQTIAKGDLWSADLPVLALALNQDLKPKKELDTTLLTEQFQWYGKNLDSVSKMMIDFKRTISFKNDYNINFKSFKDSLNANQITKKLNDFFRTEKNPSLTIYFDPLNNITSRAINFLPENDKKRMFLLANICTTTDTIQKGQLELKWNKTNRRIVLHENTHLYTNELFDKYYSQQFDKKLQQEKYENIYTDIDEIIVRAITAKIIEINYGEKEGEFEISRQPPESRIVYDYLDNYISNENMSFEEAYKEIMDKLEKSYN